MQKTIELGAAITKVQEATKEPKPDDIPLKEMRDAITLIATTVGPGDIIEELRQRLIDNCGYVAAQNITSTLEISGVKFQGIILDIGDTVPRGAVFQLPTATLYHRKEIMRVMRGYLETKKEEG